LDFEIEISYRYFDIFLAWRLFWLLFTKLGGFFPHFLVTLPKPIEFNRNRVA
jgi:hypothetical protein